MSDEVLEALVAGVVRVTGAGSAWLLVPDGDGLRVAATTAADLVGTLLDADGGAAALVLRTGQPLSASAVGVPTASGLEAVLGSPPESVLCLACPGRDDVAGVLVVVDKATGSFTVDDIEVVEVLAGIAGPALDAVHRTGPDV